ncbi:VWA domain-containing protein [Leptospira idonii]|uniref:VWA domain-containing protein n=2 Tax=Leptospira idonii TaxID=1193500 RepID=A0A4R9M5M1_9LEPT|nr:VWA domain-containing protein [Leptospira idonii]
MTEKLNGRTRMEIAKEQMTQVLSGLPKDSEVGFVAYGNRIAGCNSARLYHPIQRGGASAVIGKLYGVVPAGSTPIANTLEIVGEYILSENKETDIIFISDGVESCEGDPLAVLHALKTRGKKFNLQIMGIAIDSKGEEDFAKLAAIGNGKYYPVKDKEDMELAFQSIFSGNPPVYLPPTKKEDPKKETDVPANIRIVSILPYTSLEGSETYILHFEYDGIPNIQDYMIQMNVFSKEEKNNSFPIPPLRERRMGDLMFHDVQFREGRNGKGKMIIPKKSLKEIQTSLELWSLDDIPKIIAKSETKQLQDFSKTTRQSK